LPLAAGIVSSAVTGYLSVAFLLRFVQKHSIAPFVWYRLIAGGAVVAAILTGING
jgi:undecaprenyl-diphosphatase